MDILEGNNERGDSRVEVFTDDGSRALVSTKNKVMAKNGKQYNFFCGVVSVGHIEFSAGRHGLTSSCAIRIGLEDTDKKIIIPLDNVAGIQNTEKIFDEEVYTI